MNIRLMLGLSLVLTGCANTLPQQSAALLRIHGEIDSSQIMAPATETTLRVQLQEVRRDDPTQRRVIAQQTLQDLAQNQVTHLFSFCVSPSQLHSTHRYELRAEVYQEGVLQFSNPAPVEWSPALAGSSISLAIQALPPPVPKP